MGRDQHLLLAYHGVSDDLPWPVATPAKVFEQQIGILRLRGFVGFTLTAWERAYCAAELPERSVVVTFDDGHLSTLNSLPILERAGYPGTIFPSIEFVECEAEIYRNVEGGHRSTPMTWGQIERLAESGWEVGSHAVSHPSLLDCSEEDLRAELVESRRSLGGRYGACTSIAYPYGAANRRVAVAAKEAGYECGVTLTKHHLVNEPLRRPRLGLELRTGRDLRKCLSASSQFRRRSRLIARTSGSGRAELARV
jgi:peptidoglycan/xylan/chitin deacetylase (PgdA/CDA1 family)